MSTPIRPLPLFAPFTIPAVYDDSLSYEEHLARVIAKLNEVIERYNGVVQETENYTDTAISKLNKEFSKTVKELRMYIDDAIDVLNDAIKTVDNNSKSRYERLLSTLNANVRQLKIEIKATETKLQNAIYESYLRGERFTLAKYFEEKINREMDINVVNNRISDLVDEFPLVYNMFKAKDDTLQHTLNNLYSGLRTLCMTAKSFDTVGKTVEELDALPLNAYQWDVYSGYIFRNNKDKMFNAFTGEYQSPKKFIIDLFNALAYNGKTAGEFDGMEITAGDFDASAFNAYEQDIDRDYTTAVVDTLNKFYHNSKTVYEGNSESLNVQIPDTTLNVIYDNKSGTQSVTTVIGNSNGTYIIKDFEYDSTDGLVIYTREIDVVDGTLSSTGCTKTIVTTGDTSSVTGLTIKKIETINNVKHML